MCSLFGWLDYQGIVPYRVKKKLTQALANAAEERGTDAAGISYVHGKDVVIFKRPSPLTSCISVLLREQWLSWVTHE